MRPLLGENALLINHRIEERSPVWTESREEHQIMCRNQDVDEVNLQQTQETDRAHDLLRANRAARTQSIESLRRQRNPARFAKRKIVLWPCLHRFLFPFGAEFSGTQAKLAASSVLP